MSSISYSELQSRLRSSKAPILVDVRRRTAFRDSAEIAQGALRRDPDDVAHWAKTLARASSVVVYCVHGHEVSQNVAKALQQQAIDARYLEGGLDAWKMREGALDKKPVGASTRWVTRERPKID